ncbi:hypothetical protein [Celeribacter neptunius]|nr:hypothetical protein [Celeribacter neptunius]
MIETGGTKYLRNGTAPNKRIQDGFKLPLLCLECERETSVVENRFSQQVFIPSVTDQSLPKKLGLNEYKFVASVHHRVQAYFWRNTHTPSKYSNQERKDLQKSISLLRLFLVGKRHSVMPMQLFLLPFGLGEFSNVRNMPANWHRYIRRHMEMDIIISERGKLFGSYFKIGPWVSFCLIKNSAQPWVGAELGLRSTKIGSTRVILPPSVQNFLRDRAQNAKKIVDSISQNQQEKIGLALMEADFLVAGRPMFEAIEADVHTFGAAALRD